MTLVVVAVVLCDLRWLWIREFLDESRVTPADSSNRSPHSGQQSQVTSISSSGSGASRHSGLCPDFRPGVPPSVRGCSSSSSGGDEDDFSSSACSLLGGVYGPLYHRILALAACSPLEASCFLPQAQPDVQGSLPWCSEEVMNRRDGMFSRLETIPQERAYSPGVSIYDTSRAAPTRDWRNRSRSKHVRLLYVADSFIYYRNPTIPYDYCG